MDKFDKKYKLLIESLGSEDNIDRGIYDLYMNLVLDKLQTVIKNSIGFKNPEIEYESSYTLIFWHNENNTSVDILIDESGSLIINAKDFQNDEETILFEKTFRFVELELFNDEEFINAIIDAQHIAEDK
jgi:hypothetical protein